MTAATGPRRRRLFEESRKVFLITPSKFTSTVAAVVAWCHQPPATGHRIAALDLPFICHCSGSHLDFALMTRHFGCGITSTVSSFSTNRLTNTPHVPTVEGPFASSRGPRLYEAKWDKKGGPFKGGARALPVTPLELCPASEERRGGLLAQNCCVALFQFSKKQQTYISTAS